MPIELTDLERRIVALAEAQGAVAELCEYVEYDPDVGRVPEFFRPRYDVLRLVKALCPLRPVSDLTAFAQQHGATVYRNRTSPHTPAVAFGDEAWAKFVEALQQ